MDIPGLILWLCPLFTVVIAFFTSGIHSFRFRRYAIYLVVLFLAFLFDLQSLSFTSELGDILFAQCTLLMLADFFWRGIRMKNRILRFGALAIALVLFVVGHSDWIRGGPKRVYRFFNSKIVSSSEGKLAGYYVKTRGVLKVQNEEMDKIVLFKRGAFGILEQKLAEYRIPQGYEKAKFSFMWLRSQERIAVQITGDADTLWTLEDPGPPK